MGWSVFGKVLEASDLTSGLSVYQKVIFNKDVILTGLQTWFVVYGNPTFTNLYFEVYSLSGTTPKKLLYTSSNVVTKAEMITLAYGIKGIPMKFNDVVFKGTDQYAFVPRGTSYAPSGSAYLAWKLAYPDPAYRTNVPLSSKANLGRSPFDITGFIGAEL